VVVITVLIAASAVGWWFGEQRRTANAQYRVVEVLDGDTVVVERGSERDTIRLLGSRHARDASPTKPVQCFGPEASAYTTSRLLGQLVRLEDDVEPRDIYDRRLAYVYLDGERFEDELLEHGYARLLVIEPNPRATRARCCSRSSRRNASAAASGARAEETDGIERS
jgi:micrococcal nuclease